MSNVFEPYTPGTLSIANGSSTVIGVGTEFTKYLKGDLIVADGQVFQLASDPTTDLVATAAKTFTGTSISGAAYDQFPISVLSTLPTKLNTLITSLAGGNLLALSGITGVNGTFLKFVGPGAFELVTEAELIAGVATDAKVETLSGRSAYDAQTTGFSVYVADIGDGRAAIYFKLSAASADWSSAGYMTGEAGEPAGLRYYYDGSATTEGVSGDGAWRVNNSVFTSVTKCWLDDQQKGSTSVVSVFAAFANSNAAIKGLLIARTFDGTKQVIYNVTGYTAKTGYSELNLTHNSGSPALTDLDDCFLNVVVFGSDGTAGTNGADGADGTDGLSITWRNGWVTSTVYAVNDAVENNGSSYICITAHAAGADLDEPGIGANASIYWALMVEKGATGATGATGNDGDGLTGIQTESAIARTIVAGDKGDTIVHTSAGSISFALDPAAILGAAFTVFVKNEGAGFLTIDPDGAELIDGLTTLELRSGQSAMIQCDGTDFRTVFISTLDAVTEILTTVITADTTHNFNARRVRHEVEMVGGGGAGGGRTSTSNNHANVGAGGSAGFYKKFIVSDAGLTSATITIGAAGVGANGAVGTTGGATTYNDGTHDVSCGGGPGGGRAGGINTPYIVAPAIATETSTSFTAQEIVNLAARGEGGHGLGNNALGGSDYIFSHGGAGASTPLGAGGQARVYASNLANGADGYNASGYGSGGGGCVLSRSASGTRRGGHGAPGIVIIREYLSAVEQ